MDEFRCEANQEETLLMDVISGLGCWPGRKEGIDLGPGNRWIATMACEDGSGRRDLAPEVGVARCREIAQELIRRFPVSVDEPAAEPCETGSETRAQRASAPFQSSFRLGRMFPPPDRIRCTVHQVDIL